MEQQAVATSLPHAHSIGYIIPNRRGGWLVASGPAAALRSRRHAEGSAQRDEGNSTQN